MGFYTCGNKLSRSPNQVMTQELVAVLGDSDATIQKLGTLTHTNLHKPL